jgi:hypothetical protein
VNWHDSAYFLEESFFESFVHLVEDSLVVSLMLVDSFGNTFSSGFSTKVLRSKVFLEVDLNVTRLEVVSLYFDLPGHSLASGINDPAGLPLSTPEGSELVVNATNLNLKKAFSVEEDSTSSFSRSKLPAHVSIHAGLDIVSVFGPSLIELRRVLVSLVFAHDSGFNVKGIKHELKISLAVIVAGKVSLIFLSFTEVNHSLVAIRKVDLIVMVFKVFSKGVSDFKVSDSFLSSNFLDVS